MSVLVFDVTQDPDGGYCARAAGASIFTQGDTWEELRANIQDATKVHFFDGKVPDQVKLVLKREEWLNVA